MNNSSNNQIIPSHIADSLCRQLIAFQQTIETRDHGLQFPTPQEVNLQSKMIANVIKIKKYNATDYAAKAIAEFIRFLGKEDKQLAKIVAEKYANFIGGADTRVLAYEQDAPRNDEAPVPHKPNEVTQENRHLTQRQFDKNKEMLGVIGHVDRYSTTTFEGRIVKSMWLEYNLYQYCLPPAQRRFLNDEEDLLKLDYKAVKAGIATYLQTREAA